MVHVMLYSKLQLTFQFQHHYLSATRSGLFEQTSRRDCQIAVKGNRMGTFVSRVGSKSQTQAFFH